MSFSRSSNPTPAEEFHAQWFNNLFWFHERAADVIRASEQLIQQEYGAIKRRIDKWDEENPNHSHSGFDIHETDMFKTSQLEEDLAPALFIQQYGQFERMYEKICLDASARFNTKIKLTDLSDKGIQRSRKFIDKVLSVNLDSLNDQWQFLQEYSTVRGVLAHGEMEIPENKLNGLGHLKKNGMVTPQGIISVKTEDVRKFVHLVYDYLGSVVQKIDDKNRNSA
jgi:hypothetical protein